MSDNKARPHKFGSGKKRTRLSTEELAVITHANLKGITSEEISELFFGQTGRSLEPRTIRMILMEQREKWQMEIRRDTERFFNMELERINMMENEAWARYHSLGGYRRRKDVTQDVVGGEGDTLSTTRVEEVDDPEMALKWFREIEKLQRERRKLLNLEKQINFTQNNLYAVKGYAGWTPDAWPDAPAISDGNTIDGFYE